MFRFDIVNCPRCFHKQHRMTLAALPVPHDNVSETITHCSDFDTSTALVVLSILQPIDVWVADRLIASLRLWHILQTNKDQQELSQKPRKLLKSLVDYGRASGNCYQSVKLFATNTVFFLVDALVDIVALDTVSVHIRTISRSVITVANRMPTTTLR